MLVLIPVIIIIVVVAALAIVANKMRRVSSDPDEWHVDPTTSDNPSTPNWYRLVPDGAEVARDADRDGVAPEFDVPVADLAAAFDFVARADDRVDVLAGSAESEYVTYVQRSALFAFPDYVSVRFVESGDGGSTVAIFSRSRFGKSDLGVNEKRVDRWVAATTRRLA
jgi:hypothetical protein